ncbi:MAG: YihY family inner membrane protein [Planctomycetota bacterium]|nr:YihY family inner membrane protein [Planctomycetota bacterium]
MSSNPGNPGTPGTLGTPGTPGSPVSRSTAGRAAASAREAADGLEPGHGLMRVFQVLVFCVRKLFIQDRVSQVAAALTYRTIFSLVPTLVLSLILFRAFVGLGEVSGQLQSKAFEYLGLSSLTLPSDEAPPEGDYRASSSATQDDATSATAEAQDAAPTTQHSANGQIQAKADAKAQAQLRDNVSRIISQVTEKVGSLNFTGIGGIGILLLVWAALALVVTVEDSFNRIYRSRAGRPWHLRIAVYWAVITLGPVLLYFSIFVAASVQAWVSNTGSFGTSLLTMTAPFSALIASWLLLFLTYTLVPNARVSPRAALLGSFVAAIFWEAGKACFHLYVTIAVPYSALYGTLGLIPLFLVWVQITWMIVLFGLELTYTVQLLQSGNFDQQRTEELRRQNLCDPTAVVPVMAQIAEAFARAKRIDANDLALNLGVPVTSLAPVVLRLEQAGLVTAVPGRTPVAPDTLTLAMPAEEIPVAKLLEITRSLSALHPPTASSPLGAWNARLTEAQAAAAQGMSLADVIGKPA